jgi:16S rRNA (guanine527-N7)-methyltransferase
VVERRENIPSERPKHADAPAFDATLPPLVPPAGFLDRIRDSGLELEPAELERLGRYLAFLADANRKFNLTGVDEPEAMWIRHAADSLTLLPVLASLEARNVLDVGSGGGLPAIPLAIAMPEVRFTLLEATGKKVRFLEAAIAGLGLANATVVAARAEDAGQDRDRFRERFDAVTSRAVGPLPTLLELTLPFAKVEGHVFAIKGERAIEEIAASKRALHALHAEALEPVRTPTGTIVAILKRRPTPKMYPRRAGEPKRDPL